jgi:hypothetical protein
MCQKKLLTGRDKLHRFHFAPEIVDRSFHIAQIIRHRFIALLYVTSIQPIVIDRYRPANVFNLQEKVRKW